MSDTIQARPGSCIRLEVIYADESGAFEDISGDAFEIRDAVPASLAADLAVRPLEPAAGRIELFLDSDAAKKLHSGRTNHFRLCRLRPGGCEDNSNLLWIEIE